MSPFMVSTQVNEVRMSIYKQKGRNVKESQVCQHNDVEQF